MAHPDMAHPDAAQTIGELTALVVRIVSAIENGGGEMSLRDLQRRLVDLVIATKPNPGITAAAEDLFAAATVMVKDSALHARPEARKRRMLADARRRLQERVVGAERARDKVSCVREGNSLRLAA